MCSTFSYDAFQQMQYYIQNIPAVATLDFMYSCGGQVNTSPYYYQWQNYYYNQKQVWALSLFPMKLP